MTQSMVVLQHIHDQMLLSIGTCNTAKVAHIVPTKQVPQRGSHGVTSPFIKFTDVELYIHKLKQVISDCVFSRGCFFMLAIRVSQLCLE